MPRMARLVLPNYPHHVVHRGHNKQVVFADASDFEHYLTNLRELKRSLAVKVYAFLPYDQSCTPLAGSGR